MDLLASYDPYVILSLFFSIMLALCVFVLFLMRDPDTVPPHHEIQSVWCKERRRSARVDFVKWVNTGMVHRSVKHCSLRGTDDQCVASCRYQPVGEGVVRAALRPAKLQAS